MARVVPDSNYTQTVYFEFERDFSERTWWSNLERYFPVALVIFVIYTILAFWGNRYMRSRAPFRLRLPLTLWNAGVVVFSVTCCSRVVAERFHVVREFGFQHSVCKLESYTGPIALWATCLFTLSKVFLLGDTVFLVLKKQELTVLHWWHHISTMVFTWYMTGARQVMGRWFILIGITPHIYLYGYRVLRAAGFRPPRAVAMSVTYLLLTEMAAGIFILSCTTVLKLSGVECGTDYSAILLSMGIYLSYFVLHSNSLVTNFFSTKKKTQ